jgi:NOL1/NOP2/sun family putative RNA methylase
MNSYKLLPDKLIERLRINYPEKYNDILKAYMTKRLTTFRLNSLKSLKIPVIIELKSKNILIENQKWYKDAYILLNSNLSDIQGLRSYIDGNIYIQSLSSMIPAIILDPKKNETILDIAAAPGSKTSQIAAMMDNTGLIIANDISRVRSYKLEANLLKLGVKNSKLTLLPGQIIWKKYPEYFDKVLVDVPCSMDGRIQLSDPKSYKDWSIPKIKKLAEIQKWILRSAISSTKPGGLIVYSTCTLDAEENEKVIEWILKKEKGNIQLENIDIPGLTSCQKIFVSEDLYVTEEISKTFKILPDYIFEGFYIAKIRKIKSTVKI